MNDIDLWIEIQELENFIKCEDIDENLKKELKKELKELIKSYTSLYIEN